MLQQLFTTFSHWLASSPAVAVSAAGIWGILSIILSPCHLASLPLLVGFISMQPQLTFRKAFTTALSFSLGILISIIVVGVITALSGRLLGDLGPWVNYAVALVLIVFGLMLLDLLPSAWSAPSQFAFKAKGLLAAFILGLIFGIALGPCTFAFMAPVLGITFKLASTDLPLGLALIGAYAFGHCAAIVVAGSSTSLVQKLLDYSQTRAAPSILKKICGLLVLAAAFYLIYKA